ncbi:hypothetical protein EJB05_35022, partial [Eragrostis curvula]
MWMSQELPVQQRGDAVSSLVYEANARMRDPVYGCVGAISFLQNQVSQLQMQLAVAQAEILCIQMQRRDDDGGQGHDGAGAAVPPAALVAGDHLHHQAAAATMMAPEDVDAFLMHHHNGGQLMAGYGAAGEALKRESLWT